MAIGSIQEPVRRDQVTIMADLLTNLQEPRRLTHLLYKSNMSYTQLVKYLNSMIDLGLAKEQNKPFRAYHITNNGKVFMQIIRGGNNSHENPEIGS